MVVEVIIIGPYQTAVGASECQIPLRHFDFWAKTSARKFWAKQMPKIWRNAVQTIAAATIIRFLSNQSSAELRQPVS